jgi:hypothetical protein
MLSHPILNCMHRKANPWAVDLAQFEDGWIFRSCKMSFTIDRDRVEVAVEGFKVASHPTIVIDPMKVLVERSLKCVF